MLAGRRRVGDLFSDRTVSSRLVSMARNSFRGVENVYTQVRRDLNNRHRGLCTPPLAEKRSRGKPSPAPPPEASTHRSVGGRLQPDGGALSSPTHSMSSSKRSVFIQAFTLLAQHTPLLMTTLEAVARGRLPHMDYPYVGGTETSPTAAKVGGVRTFKGTCMGPKYAHAARLPHMDHPAPTPAALGRPRPPSRCRAALNFAEDCLFFPDTMHMSPPMLC